jgi:hypothetical protein
MPKRIGGIGISGSSETVFSADGVDAEEIQVRLIENPRQLGVAGDHFSYS